MLLATTMTNDINIMLSKIVIHKVKPTNYFKVYNKEPFFFDDHDEASVYEAWVAACLLRVTKTSKIAVFKRPIFTGPWNICDTIYGPPQGEDN
jgi:hypothetical protein